MASAPAPSRKSGNTFPGRMVFRWLPAVITTGRGPSRALHWRVRRHVSTREEARQAHPGARFASADGPFPVYRGNSRRSRHLRNSPGKGEAPKVGPRSPARGTVPAPCDVPEKVDSPLCRGTAENLVGSAVGHVTCCRSGRVMPRRVLPLGHAQISAWPGIEGPEEGSHG